MVRILGNFDVAEEVVQDSLVAALETWPKQGIPDRPAAWLMTTARRKAIDLLRRDRRYDEKVGLLEGSKVPADFTETDDRLRLIFTCCHPALSQEGQIALTLRAVAGFTTPEIAAAFRSRRRRWHSESFAPSGRSLLPASRTACPSARSCPGEWMPSSPSST
jgi:RNA polymerase sigma-70 factor (ECF subfamily)